MLRSPWLSIVGVDAIAEHGACDYAARDLESNNETEAFESPAAASGAGCPRCPERSRAAFRRRSRAISSGSAPSFRARLIRERLLGWYPAWLARRSYRGHPLAWAGLGAVVVAACLVIGLSLTESEPTRIDLPNGTSATGYCLQQGIRSQV